MLAEGTEAGVFEKSEKEIIERVLRLDDRSVLTVMTPRADIVWLDARTRREMVAARSRRAGIRAIPWPRLDRRHHRHRRRRATCCSASLKGDKSFDRRGDAPAPVLPEGTTHSTRCRSSAARPCIWRWWSMNMAICRAS